MSDSRSVEADSLATAFRNVTGLDIESAPRLPNSSTTDADDRRIDRAIDSKDS